MKNKREKFYTISFLLCSVKNEDIKIGNKMNENCCKNAYKQKIKAERRENCKMFGHFIDYIVGRYGNSHVVRDADGLFTSNKKFRVNYTATC